MRGESKLFRRLEIARRCAGAGLAARVRFPRRAAFSARAAILRLLIGEERTDAVTCVKQNSFIIWRGGSTKDFELKVEYRISANGNSGINYRSVEVPGAPWAMRGYQADIDGRNRYTGQNYEERGRTFNALRGQITRIRTGKKAEVIGSLGDAKELEGFIKKDDWNEVHLIARGNTLIHIFNGHVMSVVIDDDP